MTNPPGPDKAQGLFETLLVVDGEPIELAAHLDRLAASLKTLLGLELPAALAANARKRALGFDLGRLRITVSPNGDMASAALATEPVDDVEFFPSWEHGAHLRTLTCDGGLGRHKWADRRRLGASGDGCVPLLLDRDREVLEAGRANVFAVYDGVLMTPAADGRILPGIARAGAIAVAGEAGIEMTEASLTLDELLAADEVFLTGSVRGVEPARSLDGVPLPRAGEISRRVGDGLRRRWLAGPVAIAAPTPAVVPPPGQPVR